MARGARLTEVLKQGQFVPSPVEEQVVSIFSGVRGYLDGIEVTDVTRFEQEMIGEIRDKHADILDAIRTEGDLSEDTEAEPEVVPRWFRQVVCLKRDSPRDAFAKVVIRAQPERTPGPESPASSRRRRSPRP